MIFYTEYIHCHTGPVQGLWQISLTLENPQQGGFCSFGSAFYNSGLAFFNKLLCVFEAHCQPLASGEKRGKDRAKERDLTVSRDIWEGRFYNFG